MLRRVIALLVLLTDIAERAAGRSFPARILVLLVLRRAEAVARAYAAGTLLVDVICYEDDGDVPGGPPGATALALRFRALAAALGTLLPAADVLDAWTKTAKAARRRGLARHGAVLVTLVVAQPYPHDASYRPLPHRYRRPCLSVDRASQERPDPPRPPLACRAGRATGLARPSDPPLGGDHALRRRREP